MQGPDIGSDSTAATRRGEADTAEGLRARAGAGSQRPSHDGHFEPDGLGDTLAAISRRVVGLYKEHYGRGPVRARTYWWSDLVVVLLRDGFTPLEKTLQQAGRGDVVERVRLEFQHNDLWENDLDPEITCGCEQRLKQRGPQSEIRWK